MEKEVESSTTLAGETLAEPEQTLLGNTNKKEGGAINYGSFGNVHLLQQERGFLF